MTPRIVWTSRQTELVTAAFLSIIKADLPEYRLREGETVGSSFIRSNMPRAQQVLPPDSRRTCFAKALLIAFSERVSAQLWKLQLEEDKKRALLGGLPLETLIEEIARRQQDSLLESLMTRIEGPLTARLMARVDELVSARLDKVLEARKHVPWVASTEEKVSIPDYVLVGLLPAQLDSLTLHFKGQCTFTHVDSAQHQRVKDVTPGRVVFVSRFVDHSIWHLCQKNAAQVFFARTVPEFKPLITNALRALKETQ